MLADDAGSNFKALPIELRRRAVDEICTSLVDSLAGRKSDEQVQTDVKTLQTVGSLLRQLMDEVGQCGGEDCLGRRVNGIRQWVTADRLVHEAERARRAEAEVAALKRELAAAQFGDLRI